LDKAIIFHDGEKLKEAVLGIFFPVHCPVCDRVLPFSSEICPECERVLRRVKAPVCAKCGKHIRRAGDIYCFDCLRNPKPFMRGFSLYEYASVHDSVSRFKNLGRPDYGIFYGRQMGRFLLRNWRGPWPEALIPIPLHPDKERLRGYNQSAVLAQEIEKLTGIPLREDILIRTNQAKVQKNLGRMERQKNMKKAFQLHKNDVKLKTVVLVDDVYTTGSTIAAATDVLKSAGVEDVYYITLAIGAGLKK
jgi:ComF family protein